MKPLWQSKIFWVNLLTTVASVLTLLSKDQLIGQYPNAVAAIVAVLGLINIGLRIITTDAIKWLILLAVMLACQDGVAADGLSKESVAAILAASQPAPNVDMPIIEGKTEVDPGGLVTQTLKLAKGQSCAWLIVPLDTPMDVRRIAGADGEHTSVLNFATGEAPADKRPWSFVVVSVLFTGQESIEPVITLKTVNVKARPGPDPIVPVPPDPVVPTGKRSVVIVRETADQTPEMFAMVKRLRTGEESKYLASKGHSLTILDDDLPAAKSWLPHVEGLTLPAVVIVDPAANKKLAAASIGHDVGKLMDLLKKNGG